MTVGQIVGSLTAVWGGEKTAAKVQLFIASTLAALRAPSMKVCTTGLRVRFFNVTMASGLSVTSGPGSKLSVYRLWAINGHERPANPQYELQQPEVMCYGAGTL